MRVPRGLVAGPVERRAGGSPSAISGLLDESNEHKPTPAGLFAEPIVVSLEPEGGFNGVELIDTLEWRA
jgi:hypothetical protein